MMSGLRWVALPMAVVGIVGSLLILDPFSRFDLDGAADSVSIPVREQSEITVATLTTTNEVDGELRAVEHRPVIAITGGTVTGLASVGTAIEPGAVLLTIDEVPTVALPGETPAWRTMTVGDVGPDVAQLEAALVALGYDPDGDLTLDDTYTSFTATVVERWQADVGLTATGTVALGSVAFVPSDARVTSVAGAVGATVTPGTPVLELGATERELVFTVGADHLSTLDPGSTVTMRLPDRTVVDVTVADVVGGGDGSWIVTAHVDGAAPLPDGDAVPVTVLWSHVVAEDVVTVRAGALTRLDSGAYVVEIVESDSTTHFVEVGIGASSGSTVEIITDVEPGTTVVG